MAGESQIESVELAASLWAQFREGECQRHLGWKERACKGYGFGDFDDRLAVGAKSVRRAFNAVEGHERKHERRHGWLCGVELDWNVNELASAAVLYLEVPQHPNVLWL